MGNFAYIPVIAVICYSVLMLILLAAKKNNIINAFLLILAVLILWTGGSFCMRMQLWPSMAFWYNTSILGLTLFSYSLLKFICEFIGKKSKEVNIYLVIIILINIINARTGFFLKAPETFTNVQGETVFVYHYTWTVFILFFINVAIFLQILYFIYKYSKNNALAKKQLMPIILGIIILFAGHFAILFPNFKGIPTDILSGIFNAFFIFYAVYKRNIFELKLIISKGSCYVASAALSFLIFLNLIVPLETFINDNFSTSYKNTILIIAFIYAFLINVVYHILKGIIDTIFIKDEIIQMQSIKEFSLNISKSLNVNEIMEELAEVIQKSTTVKKVFICTADKTNSFYEVVHSTDPLGYKAFNLKIDNPMIKFVEQNNECLLMKDFKRTIEYKSMWEKEKSQLVDLNIECVVPLRDDNGMIGIILLSEKEKKESFTFKDISFLSSINSMGSIAVKNSKLFEQVYLEARTDELTGLLNRKYFYEVIQQEYEKCNNGSLALIILNIDDFKLYNQLYGNKEGDIALNNIAQIIKNSVGTNGYVARYSGKEFAIILPSYDLHSARNLAETIRKQILGMNRRESDYALKMLTVSGGICAIPYSASNIKQLIENADMSIYAVKHNGKNAIMVYTGNEPKFERKIVNFPERKENIYSEYASTIYALTAAIDTKDHYTFKHSNSVACYATELAYAYGLNDDCVEIIREAALLHDIGKIGIPEHILNKPSNLTDEEYKVIKGHVENSVGIIRHLPSLDYVIPAVIGHHERYDGNGYPRRISKEDIPISARILCIADSFDAMISERPYKQPYSVNVALRRLEEQAGLQFDPKLVRIFIKLVENGTIKVCEEEPA